jgi:hypothetical protein
MPETTTTTLPSLNPCRKDPVPVPLPTPRALGLTRLLQALDVGESGVIPRHAAGDLYKTGLTLGRTFTTRRIDTEWSRVWRLT